MKYDFRCEDCEHVQTEEFSIHEFDGVKEDGIKCSECGGDASFEFNTDGMMFSFVGDAWTDKNYREKKYRKNRSKYMAQRQAKNHKRPTLKPNYKGQEARSWKEAKEAAKADGKNTLSYEPLIQREKLEEKGS